MPLSTGTILNNRYRIVRVLGQGGFGAVYRAWDLNLERPCAVKENLDATEEGRSQFKREAKLLADLDHPNLPNVTDHFFLTGHGQYLVMDYVEGEDLQTKLDKNDGKPLPEGEVLTWIDQVCDALIYLHEQEPPIIHRDIKPANIRLTPDGKAMLVDFGIAKVFTPGLRTLTGARAYTPGYASPEQQGGEGTDALSDVYSLGATAYSLLTGLVPPSATDIISGLQPPPPPVNHVNPNVSPRVSRAIHAAMQLNRTQRMASALEFRNALRTTAAVITSTPGTELSPAKSREKVTERTPRRPAWLPWVGGVSLALLGILVGYALFSLISNGGYTSSDLTATAREAILSDQNGTRTAIAAIPLPTRTSTAAPTPAETSTPTETSPPTSTPNPTDTALPTSTSRPSPSPTPTGVPGMALVPAGPFMMGSEDGDSYERPPHEVYLDVFYIDIYEVTNAQYAQCVADGDCGKPGCLYYEDEGNADHPVVCVSWYDARDYCQWRGVRLPTEAEWEKAARGGLQGMRYPWGDETPVCDPGVENGAQFLGCPGDTVAIGSFRPNGYGLYDMAGNVWEWVSSLFQSYPYDSDDGREDPGATGVRVLRGGSWNANANFQRVSVRYLSYLSDDIYLSGGIRCARSP